MNTFCIWFNVEGIPRAKQSFRYSPKGGGYTPAGTVEWQNTIGYIAKESMQGRTILDCDLCVVIHFFMSTKIKVDIDNLSKTVLDACNHIIWNDDRQVVELHLYKAVQKEAPGILVCITPAATWDEA